MPFSVAFRGVCRDHPSEHPPPLSDGDRHATRQYPRWSLPTRGAETTGPHSPSKNRLAPSKAPRMSVSRFVLGHHGGHSPRGRRRDRSRVPRQPGAVTEPQYHDVCSGCRAVFIGPVPHREGDLHVGIPSSTRAEAVCLGTLSCPPRPSPKNRVTPCTAPMPSTSRFDSVCHGSRVT